MIDTIFLFSAGRGSRMRHLTENNPKCLIPILNKPILHHTLSLCKSYPFKRIVINTHYLQEQIIESIKDFQSKHPDFPEIITIYEKELLETGGAIKNAYDILGDKPVFTLHTDLVLKSQHNVFKHLLESWDPESMDFLLLMQPYEKTIGYAGYGDFDLNSDGALLRSDKEGYYDYLYAGLGILKPEKVARNPLKIFSLQEYYLNSTKARGVVAKDLDLYHANTPEDIVDIEINMLANRIKSGQ